MAIYSEFSPLKMVIFHSYVSLPEGIHNLGIPPKMGNGTHTDSESFFFLY